MFTWLLGGSEEAQLRAAAMAGELRRVQTLVDKGVDVNAADEYGRTALHHASSSGHAEVVCLLLRHEACAVNASDEDGETALHCASLAGHTPVVRVLLGHRSCDVNASTQVGRTPLHLASSSGRVDIVRELLDYESCDVNMSDEGGRRALHYASTNGHAEVVRVLLSREDCDVNAPTKVGRAALHLACSYGHAEVFRVLVGHVACDVKASSPNGQTALHYASSSGRAELVRELLDLGLDPTLQNKVGETPLSLCFQLRPHKEWSWDEEKVFWGVLETARALLSAGATYDGPTEVFPPVRGTHEDLAAIISICMRHWTKEQQRKKKSLTVVPFETFKRGSKAVETYLTEFDASDESDLVWRRKVCVVGSSKAGKTSLIKSITSMTPTLEKDDVRTIGVDLFRLQFAEDVNTDHTVEQKSHAVTFWDFAGQDEYHVAHTLFFSRRTLYLLCVDMEEFDQVIRKADGCEDEDEAESLVLTFVQERVWRWFRVIFARQPDAEFALIATKTDALGGDATSRMEVLEGELFEIIEELKQVLRSEIQREISTLANGTAESGNSARITDLQHLEKQLETSFPTTWIGLSISESSSIQRARAFIEDVVKHSDRSFVMPDKYSRVLHRVEELRQEARDANMKNRIRQSFVSLTDLVKALTADIHDLSEDDAITILEALHDLGDVLWYARDGHHMLGDTIILDAEFLIDFIRQIVCHDPAKISAANDRSDGQSDPLIQAMNQNGTVSNELLRHKFSWWKRLAYPDQLLQFKLLLQHFNLAYPACGDTMQADSDLIVPTYWRLREKQIDLGRLKPLPITDTELSQVKTFLWEYYLGDNSAEVVDTVFQQLVVRSYYVFPNRAINSLCVESVQDGRLAIRIACGMVGSRGPVIRLQVLGKEVHDPSGWLRDVHEAIEAVLKMFPGILVTRKAVADSVSCNLDDCIPRWRALPYNQREAQLHEHSWLPDGVIDWFRRTDRGVRNWYISPESIVKHGPAFAEGGFGKVYLAKWQHTDVVVKEVSTSEMHQFLGEVTLWCDLRHPNVVQFLGANDQTKPYFIVSTYAAKGELLHFIANEKKDERVVVWRKLYEAAAGLSHLHRRGIVHGDLKGDNILVGKDGTAMVADFGLSFSESGSSSVVSEKKETLGAMAWRSPEFANLTVERPTRKSDVYSLGMCIIEAVTGEKPWGRYTSDEIREFLRKGEVKVDKPAVMTETQWELVRQMIAPLPNDRPELSAVMSKLEEFADAEQDKENAQLCPYD